MRVILGIVDLMTDVLIACGCIMSLVLIALWIWQVVGARPPKE